MGAALTIALSLALVFTLLSVILADLLCSLLCCRKHRLERTAPNTSDAAAAAAAEEDPPTPPLSFPFYAHGVLQAPTTFLLTIPKLEAATAAAAAAALPPKHVECKSRMPLPVEHESPSVPASPCIRRISSASVNSAAPEHFVCISNPIYDGIGGGEDNGTPFETPDTSPSSSLGLEEETESDYSPQLTVMKKLPSMAPQALSAVALMDGRRSLPTSASATETNRLSSSSSSYSLCCSPSW